MTKLNIISGFLGAGKTTLIKKLIRDAYPDDRIVVLLNEFGDEEIDAEALRGTHVIVEGLQAGCICCQNAMDFARTIDEIIDWTSPDRIIVEPSGMAKLSDIRRVIDSCENRNLLEIEALTTVVDAVRCGIYLGNYGEFYKDQIESAEVIFLTGTERLPIEKVRHAENLIRNCNPCAEIITTPIGMIHGAILRENLSAANYSIG